MTEHPPSTEHGRRPDPAAGTAEARAPAPDQGWFGALRRRLGSLFGLRGTGVAAGSGTGTLGDPGSPAGAATADAAALRSMLSALLADRRSERRMKLARAVLYFLMFAGPAVLYAAFYAHTAGWRMGPGSDVVGVVRLHGEMASGNPASADRVIPLLRKAFESERVRAIVLSVDSPGGAPLEAERIYSAIESYRKTYPKPVVSVIANQGTSAAYMVALHTDKIYAGQYSLVGSVGAILSGWDAHLALQRLGVSQRVYASGELKSMMNPFAAMTPEAERKARDLVEQMGSAFRDELIQERSHLLAKGVDFGSGGVWGGAEAHRLGLVDGVLTIDRVINETWPTLGIHDYGPHAPGLPFAGASTAAADWLAGVLRTAVTSVRLH